MIKVLIVDDHEMAREFLLRSISKSKKMKIVGEATTGEKAINFASKFRPDVILMDIKLPGISGIEATRRIIGSTKNKEKPKIIILSMFDDESHIAESLRAGATGYITKDTSSEEILEAIQRVIKGEIFIQRKVTPKFLKSFSDAGNKENALTLREVELIKYVAKGLANKEIARAVSSSEKTVKNQLNIIFSKLGVVNRAQLVTEAIRRNIITPDIS